MKKFLTIMGIMLFMITSCTEVTNKRPVEIDERAQWVDSIYSGMSLKEKVGQLFMVSAYSNRDDSHTDSIHKLINDYHLGGLIFFQGGPIRQATQTNLYQSASKIPLFIGIDGEWGLNMRLDSTSRYPYNMTLGAITNNKIIRKIGEQIGKDCKRMGIHINFAPVVDINTNSENPVIGVRSFGEDKVNVTEKAWAFTDGLQSAGVLASAKHFPGHGDTASDSHKTLPTVAFTKERLDTVELYPYKELFNKGVAGVMVAHLNVPNLERQEGLPSSLSYQIVTELLKEQLGYEGLIFTDALNMKGVADYGQPGDIDLAAFKAGNDVLLFTEDAPKAISRIMEAYQEKEITEQRLAHSVKKILNAKYDVGLNAYKPIELENLVEELNRDVNQELYQEAIRNAITLVKNEEQLLPLTENDQEKIAFVNLGNDTGDLFFEALKLKGNVTDIKYSSSRNLLNKLRKFDRVIIGYHRKNSRITRAISAADKRLIETISKNHKTILTVFASQYSLKETNLNNVESVLISFENSEVANRATAEIIFGESEVNGVLPASISKDFPVQIGINISQ
ncbi:glycoside hydrolase family 3 protein [Gelidibacter maritimus]|uniref:beta-N-acetylhexosaminidase n=1 Tax=Gelidibacter maritimus TaxID=2761487 RepID=A0A7W2M4V4_9FLAO|nr:glycoside hydrolase family 3 protein [Gelidibacter maritimus]MBA6152481.1 glycoside hydrolase family 3 C-terminal domain-containing protein [Gelidibacter maritimus]